jgi:hypothetical protein
LLADPSENEFGTISWTIWPGAAFVAAVSVCTLKWGWVVVAGANALEVTPEPDGSAAEPQVTRTPLVSEFVHFAFIFWPWMMQYWADEGHTSADESLPCLKMPPGGVDGTGTGGG